MSGLSQPRLTVSSNNYFEVSSYLGVSTHARFNTFQFESYDNKNTLPNWSLSVRLVKSITPRSGKNRTGKTFPPDKISLRWTEDNGVPSFNLNGIGASRNDIFLTSATEVFLVQKSNQPLAKPNADNLFAQLYGMVKIAAGKYLDDYRNIDPYSPIQYDIPLQVTLYANNGSVYATQTIPLLMQIGAKLTDEGAVDIEPDYSLQFDAAAMNASLQFFTKQHYKDGVQLMVNSAVKVHSVTDYELRVKSLDPELVRAEGGALPLSILSLQMQPVSGGSGTISNPKIQLSTQEQVAFAGRSQDKTIAHNFNVQYEAKLTPSQVLFTKPGNYSVSLLYLLMPK